MPEVLRYDQMVEDALRGVVRQALAYAARNGLPGDHHFYITFRTDHPGVNVAPRIRARYPEEMTIVLQHQFWDLDVGEDAFGVTLSFSGVSERLHIPFVAVAGFADPSAKFGLQFEMAEGDEAVVDAGGGDGEEHAAAEPEIPTGEQPGKVVALDAFRKK